MGIKVICLGKTKDSWLQNGCDEYLKRLQSFAPVEILVLPDQKIQKNTSREMIIEKEGDTIFKNISPQDFLIALDEGGKQFTSEKFAATLEDLNCYPLFLIGGVYGLSPFVKQRANLVMSLSTFTFTHQMARVIILEQLYRAYTIIKGKQYHY